MEEGIVRFLYLHESLSHSLMEGVGLGVVENQFHHLLKLVCICWHDVVLSLLQGLKEYGLDAIG